MELLGVIPKDNMKPFDLKEKGKVTAEGFVQYPAVEDPRWGSPQNLLSDGEESWNKWFQHSDQEVKVLVELQEPIEVIGFGFKNADDVRYFDIKNVKVEFKNPAGKFVNIKLSNVDIKYSKEWSTI